MSGAIAELARMIEEASGFVVSPRGYGQLTAVAREQIAALKLSGIEEYMDLLAARPESPEWRILLGRITVKESYLFRGRAQFTALSGTILDELTAVRRDRRLRVWCAGCARGEEAVTLAIVLASHPVVSAWDWSVLATDVDDQALDEARLGRYGERALAVVPPEVLASRFKPRSDRYEVDPKLLDRITYERLNLVDPGTESGLGPFDVIFLRNVLIYFRPELQQRVVRTVERSLAPHGTLFLGPSESLLPLEASLKPRDLGTCFCYQWPSPKNEALQPGPAARPQTRDDPGKLREPIIPARPPFEPEAGGGPGTADERIGRVVNAIAEAEVGGATDIVRALRSEFPEKPIVHALAGLTADRVGDPGSAVLAYRAALYLGPDLPEYHFLLAQALEADGRLDRALKEYRSTLSSLGAGPAPPSPVLAAAGVPDRDQILSMCLKKISINKV